MAGLCCGPLAEIDDACVIEENCSGWQTSRYTSYLPLGTREEIVVCKACEYVEP